MWLVEGAFDQSGDTNLDRTKLKLLKPGKSYPLGRKRKHPLQLVLSHPKISGEHLILVVGENPVASVDDPTFIPTLKVQNNRAKALQVSRTINGNVTRHMIQASSEDEVLPGDCIALVTGIYITIHWRPICCLFPHKSPSLSFERCSSLGVKVVSTPRPEVTHHLTATFSASMLIAISLLNQSHTVRPDWLDEILHLGETTTSADGPSVLETEFRLPAMEQFVPKIDAAVPAPLKSPAVWKLNQRRAGILRGWRFLFVGAKGREVDMEPRTLVERGGGDYEVFDVSGGVTRWKQSLSRNKRKANTEGGKGLCVVESSDSLKIAAGDAWNEMLEELAKAELCFVPQTQLVHAVVLVDAERLNSRVLIPTERDSSVPDRVSNTFDDEPSASHSHSRSNETPKSASSIAHEDHRQASHLPEPAANDQQEGTSSGMAPENEPPQISTEEKARGSEEPEGTTVQRRPLVRRARTNATQPIILGVDDPSFASLVTSQPPAAEVQNDKPTVLPPAGSQASVKPPSSQTVPAGRSSRLKKRARIEKDYNPILANLEQEIAAAAVPPAEQPPLKRFKALFDETDPDRIASQATNGVSGGILDSQMFSQETSANDDVQAVEPSRAPLVTIREEEEEIQPTTNETDARRENAEMDVDNTTAPSQPQTQAKPTSKANTLTTRAPSQHFDSTQASRQASSKGGAEPGKPDTDAAFLQALASTKKGKKREDDFDREFNNLRISKPEQDHDAEAEDWKVLADFGDDSNIRGNFMVIVEMDVPEKPREASVEPSSAQSRGPDFKKFKKKTNGQQKPSVELVADIENDYGMGTAYWKGSSQSQHHSQGAAASQDDHFVIPKQGFLQPSQTQNRAPIQPKSVPSSQFAKPRSRNQTQAQTQTQRKKIMTEIQEAPRRTRSRPLRIVEEEEDEEEEEEEIEKPQPRTTRRGRGTATNGKKKTKGDNNSQPLFLSDEDEDENDTGTANKGNGVENHDEEEFNLDLDSNDDKVEMFDEETAAPTLRSTAPSTAESEKPKPSAPPSKRGPNSKKRGAALLEDDEDTGIAFKGFGGRKRTRVK